MRPQAPHEVDGEVEACFQQALAVARQQKARSLELRAIMSLCGRRRGQAADVSAVHRELAQVYDWFSEGFDTPDLVQAKALLDPLAAP
jgi:predicted ATPase